jgi:predicted transcriptional regulator YdeE
LGRTLEGDAGCLEGAVLSSRRDSWPNGRYAYDICLEKNGDSYVQLIGAEVTTIDGVPPKGMEALHVPEQMYIHYRHTGTLAEIAGSFARMYEWAVQTGYQVDDFKIDIGYTVNGKTEPHDLYVRLADSTSV